MGSAGCYRLYESTFADVASSIYYFDQYISWFEDTGNYKIGNNMFAYSYDWRQDVTQ